MSLNYAASLSPYANKGKCGLPETFESAEVVTVKCQQLAELIKNSKRIVCLTGAGLSTSCGIPDFRGPNGVWTLEKKGLSLPESEEAISFDKANPSYTHYALVELSKMGKLDFLISQNIDGLHMKSGFPMSRLAELHGNMFVEKCSLCSMKYVTSKCAERIGLKPTGRKCRRIKARGSCRGELHDTILDWNDELPHEETYKSELNCKRADLCICLGTTLQIMPVGGYPMLTKKNGGKLVIINLQETRLDYSADLVIREKLDFVFKTLFEECLHVQNINVETKIITIKKELAEDDLKYHLNVSDMRVDPKYYRQPHLVILLSGKRKSGKTFVSDRLLRHLRENSSRYTVNEIVLAAPLKEIYARENSLDYERLLDSSSYKENHRVDMIRWSDSIRLKDPFFFCRLAVEKASSNWCPEADVFDVWIVTDLRLQVELEYFRVNYPGLLKTVRIVAEDSVRKERGWVFAKGADDWTSECDLDSVSNWDFVIRNGSSAEELNKDFGVLANYLNESRRIYCKSQIKQESIELNN